MASEFVEGLAKELSVVAMGASAVRVRVRAYKNPFPSPDHSVRSIRRHFFTAVAADDRLHSP